MFYLKLKYKDCVMIKINISLMSLLFLTSFPSIILPAAQKLTPANTEFAWDLHDVVVQHNIPAIICQSMPSWCAILNLACSSKKEHRILCAKLKKLKDTAATGQAYTELLHEYDLNKLGGQFRKLACLQKPTKGIKELMAQLHTMGYIQRPCSNIGSMFFQDLEEKMNSHFSFFSPGTSATYEPDGTSIIKPDPAFYEMHNNKFNPDRDKTFLFIDDKLKNVKAARNAGWIGLQFKNVPQLRDDLQILGIDVQKKLNLPSHL